MALYNDYRDPTYTVTDAAAINNAIRNILFTAEGSLPGKPTFGSRINEVIFNQIDYITADLLESLIREALEKWEKRIYINRVQVKEVPEYNKIIAKIDYSYRDKGLDLNESISITLIE